MPDFDSSTAALDLRVRIARGDLVAITDPSLPLHLFAEPGGEWWVLGRMYCALDAIRRLAADIGDPATVRRVVDTWGREHGACGRHWKSQVGMLNNPATLPEEARQAVRQCLALMPSDGTASALFFDRTPRVIDLVRRLRALSHSTLPEIDAAIELLLRYTDG